MKKYEYKVVTIATAFAMNTKQYEKMALDFETQLNELGREGWEMVQTKDSMFFFKRELQ